LDAGGFDEGFRRAEDVELAYRLADRGLGFVFNMKAVGLHFADRSFRSWLEAAKNYGRNDVIFSRDRNQKWLLPAVESEFHKRHVLLRLLVCCCKGRPRATALARHIMKIAADAATSIGAERMERFAYSGLFNLQYFSGVNEELGPSESPLFSYNRKRVRG
jgi:GT2 family glycosyltransferase